MPNASFRDFLAAVLRRLAPLAACALLVVAPLTAAAQDPPPGTPAAAGSPERPDGVPADHVSPHPEEASGEMRAVIPAGQEERLSEIIGKGIVFPGDCKFSGGKVERFSVHATYACGSGQVGVDLRHPERAPAAAPRTDRFALVVTGGTAPEGFLDALLAHVRGREAGFEWKWIGKPSTGTPAWVLLAAVFAIAALVGFAWVRWSRSGRGASGA